jgi:brefeldin A-inhibited guanine nucleotide-exchange protein 3
MCVHLLKSAYNESCSHYIDLFLEHEGPSAADRLSEQSLLVFLLDDDAPLPHLARERSLREMVADKLRRRRQSNSTTTTTETDVVQPSEPVESTVTLPPAGTTNVSPHSHKAVPEDRIYTVATDRTIKSVMTEYRKRKQTHLMPKSSSAVKSTGPSKSKPTAKSSSGSGKVSRSQSLSSNGDPVERQIAEQQKASIMKDGEAHLRSSVEMLCNCLQLLDQLPDGEYHALLPVAFACVAQLVGHCRDRQLREALAHWTYRVGFLFEFAAPGDHLTPLKY